MSLLYIANCTQFNHMLYWRMTFNESGMLNAQERVRSLKQITIGSGKVAPVGGDLHITQIEHMIGQWEQFGIVNITEVNRLPKKQLSFIYSVDKVIPAKFIEEIHEHNKDILRAQGDERRRQAAVGTSAIVERHMEQAIKGFDLEVEQAAPDPGEKLLDKPLAFGAHVSKDTQETPSSVRVGRRGRRG